MSKYKRNKIKAQKLKPKCGLCKQSRKPLRKTECCDNLICDDWHEYQMLSYAHNSCSRNHDHYTVCATHFNAGHEGDWQECQKCRKNWETEMYVHFATNEYNFVKLENPPEFEPTHCAGCDNVIDLGNEGYMISGGEYFCEKCTSKKYGEIPDFSSLI